MVCRDRILGQSLSKGISIAMTDGPLRQTSFVGRFVGLCDRRWANADVAIGWILHVSAVVSKVWADRIDQPTLRRFLDVQRLAGVRIGGRVRGQAKLREFRYRIATGGRVGLQSIEPVSYTHLTLPTK